MKNFTPDELRAAAVALKRDLPLEYAASAAASRHYAALRLMQALVIGTEHK